MTKNQWVSVPNKLRTKLPQAEVFTEGRVPYLSYKKNYYLLLADIPYITKEKVTLIQVEDELDVASETMGLLDDVVAERLLADIEKEAQRLADEKKKEAEKKKALAEKKAKEKAEADKKAANKKKSTPKKDEEKTGDANE